jgi:hypothetical protein
MFVFDTKIVRAAVLAGVGAISIFAQGKPGVDRPIRVGQFKGTAPNQYWHENIHSSSTMLNNILTNPSATVLGPGIVVPKFSPPFTFTTFGVTQGGGNNPTAAMTNAFIAALDTLDVAIISCMVGFDQIISTATQRDALANFARKKGYLAVHATTDSRSSWSAGDSIHGTRFSGHPSSDRMGTIRRDSVFQTDSAWKFLNSGVFSNGTDTSFVEEWFFFTTSGTSIRSQANLKPTMKLVESSLEGGLGGQTAMGDHPHSWYRTHPQGGRFFYTGVGHRPNLWNTNAQAPRFFRRQLYNAIVWLSDYDSTGVVSIKRTKAPGPASDYSRLAVSPSELTVTMILDGDHSVELLTLDGKRVEIRQGSGSGKSHHFSGLKSGVYILATAGIDGRASRLVTIP